MTEQQKRKFVEENILNFENYARKYLKIRDKAGQIVPLAFNEPQRMVLRAIQRCVDEKRPIRVIVLKARQFGISTLIEAFLFWKTTNFKNVKSGVLTHEAKATQNLFEMTKRYYNNLPEPLRPELEHQNQTGLKYASLDSSVVLWTAGTGDVGSSFTTQFLHLSEVSKYPDAKTTLLSLLQTVPDTPNSMVVMESTANGIGGEFYNRWKSAETGESTYIPVFISWLVDNEYTLRFKNEEDRNRFMTTLNAHEEVLTKYGATPEHLHWRRKIGIPDKCGNDPDQFAQEYPHSPEAAFIASGRPFFDVKFCSEEFNRTSQITPVTGFLEYKGKDSVVFTESPKGYIKVFKEIIHKKDDMYRFCAGADVAEGLAQGDYSSLTVLDRSDLSVALTWHGHIDPDLFADEWRKVYLYLNKDLHICPERNNHGLATIIRAYSKNIPMYYNQSFEKGYPTSQDVIGFKTSSSSKLLVLNDLQEAIRDRSLFCDEKGFWSEALTFVRNEKGQLQAEGKDRDPSTKTYDDRIISMALAWRCHLWLPNYRNVAKRALVTRGARNTSRKGVTKF